MPPTDRDQLPTRQQLDHLVFELLDPIHHLDDGARQTLLARARHFRLGPGEGHPGRFLAKAQPVAAQSGTSAHCGDCAIARRGLIGTKGRQFSDSVTYNPNSRHRASMRLTDTG